MVVFCSGSHLTRCQVSRRFEIFIDELVQATLRQNASSSQRSNNYSCNDYRYVPFSVILRYLMIALILVCMANPVLYPPNTRQYFFSSQTVVQSAAQSYCTSSGGILCTISTAAENNFVNNNRLAINPAYIPYGGSAMWIGLYRTTDTSPWQWYDGEPHNYDNFQGPGQGVSGNGETLAAV